MKVATNCTQRLLNEMCGNETIRTLAGREGWQNRLTVSDYYLARVIGVTVQQLSQWRRGVRSMSNDRVIRSCQLMGYSVEQTLERVAEFEAERTQNQAVVDFWSAISRKGAACLAGAILAGAIAVSPDANASGAVLEHKAPDAGINIMLNARRLWRRLRRRLDRRWRELAHTARLAAC